MNSRPLKVLVVADDRGMLRHLSRFLNTFGYEVQQAADQQLATAALEADAPDLLIVDSGWAAGSTSELSELTGALDLRPLYTFLLIEDPSPQDLLDALAAGVDDFLSKPIVYGELLVRLRAAVRALEFERRVREQECLEPLSGLLSRRAFCDRLRRELSAAGPDASGACVVADLDFLERINRSHGRAAGDVVVQAVANELSELAGDAAVVSAFGGGRFAVWLPELSEGGAVEWAEHARNAVAEMEISLGDGVLRVTASLGVAGRGAGVQTPEELVHRATEALKTVKTSGRNWVARFDQFAEESKVWQELAAPGKLFERTVARDVMMPCTALLRSDDLLTQAEMLFRQTHLNALPVVDPSGKLVGLVCKENMPAEASDSARPSARVADLMTTKVARYEEDTTFAELIQIFKREAKPLVAIVDDGRPTGFLTPRSLAALSEPLKTDRFASTEPYSHTSDYLVVPEPSLVEEA